MNTLEIPEKKIYKEFPSCWEEMTNEQFIFVMKHYVLLEAQKINIHDFKVRVISYFLDIKNKAFHFFSEEEQKLIASNMYVLTEHLDFLFSEQNNTITLNLDFVSNFVPTIKVNKFFRKNFYGPKEALSNISFFEYIELHKYYTAFAESNDEKDLDNLIAVMYRPKRFFHFILKRLSNYNGQLRVKFNDNKVEQYAAKLAKVPYYIKYAVFCYFIACEKYIRTADFNIDGNTVNFSVLFKQGEPDGAEGDDYSGNNSVNLGLRGVLFKLSESQIFGNIKETANHNLFDVLFRLYQQFHEYKKTEKK